jgi:hypothetical protein
MEEAAVMAASVKQRDMAIIVKGESTAGKIAGHSMGKVISMAEIETMVESVKKRGYSSMAGLVRMTEEESMAAASSMEEMLSMAEVGTVGSTARKKE